VAFSPDGRSVATTSDAGRIQLWNAVTGKRSHELEDWHREPVTVAFSPDSLRLVSGSYERSIKIWDVVSGECLKTLTHCGRASAVAFSPDGRCVLAGLHDGTVTVWEVTTGRCLHTVRASGESIIGLAFSPDGRRILTGSASTLASWELDSVGPPREVLRICSFTNEADAWWQPNVSRAPGWTGDAWRWLGWRVRNSRTGAIERYPIECFASASLPDGAGH
jgi:WD40 repeat protein